MGLGWWGSCGLHLCGLPENRAYGKAGNGNCKPKPEMENGNRHTSYILNLKVRVTKRACKLT